MLFIFLILRIPDSVYNRNLRCCFVDDDNRMNDNFIAVGMNSIRQQSNALLVLSESLDANFSQVIRVLLNCIGRIIVVGMGKSGHVGKKIAATLASTGTPAMFVHPAEASHGDLGMIQKNDIVIAISKSGESVELFDTIDYCRRFCIKIVAITGNKASSLGQAADYLLLLPDIDESCPLNLAPTTSTTMTLALGDAIAVACLNARNFQATQFRDFHPGGKLGQKLLRVRDLMHVGKSLPLIISTSTLSDAILEMTRGRFGCVGIVDTHGNLVGIFTDGDLRRHFSVGNISRSISELMNALPHSVEPDAFLSDVTYLLTEKRIPSVFVCVDQKPIGIVHIHDILQKGLV